MKEVKNGIFFFHIELNLTSTVHLPNVCMGEQSKQELKVGKK